jgi:hypothetical protein
MPHLPRLRENQRYQRPADGDALWPIIVLAIGIGILLRAVTERPPA